MKNKQFVIFLVFISLVAVIGGFSGIYFLNTSRESKGLEIESVDVQQINPPDEVPVIEVPAEPESVQSIVAVAQEDGVTAFDLLQQSAEINYKMYDFGFFVNDINGIASSDEYFWALYINGEKATKGADQIELNKGDEMEWRYERMKY